LKKNTDLCSSFSNVSVSFNGGGHLTLPIRTVLARACRLRSGIFMGLNKEIGGAGGGVGGTILFDKNAQHLFELAPAKILTLLLKILVLKFELMLVIVLFKLLL
jgi:hypothetical protein